MQAKIVIEKKGEKDGGHWRIFSFKAKRRWYKFFEDENEDWQIPLIEAQEGDTVEFYFIKEEYKGKSQWTIVGPDDPQVRSEKKLDDLIGRVEILEAGMGDVEELTDIVAGLKGGE